MRTQVKPSRAFTLIELLVVVAIIALIIAILLPSLASARSSSRRAACAANLHGLSQVLVMYEGDWGRYPINPREDYSNRAPWLARSWSGQFPTIYSRGDAKCDLRFNFGGTYDPVTHKTAEPGMLPPKLMICPGPSPIRAAYSYGDAGVGNGYGYTLANSQSLRPFYHSNYLFLYADPGNQDTSAGNGNNRWFNAANPSLALPGTYLGPKSSKEPADRMLFADTLAYDVGGALGYSNHASGAGTRAELLGTANAAPVAPEFYSGPANSLRSWGVGANVAYNDCHVEFKKTGDLYPMYFNAANAFPGATNSATVTYLDPQSEYRN